MASAPATLDRPVAGRPAVPPSAPTGARPAPRRRRPWQAARSVLFWTHLVVGVATGVVVLVMSATGTALTFQRQLLDWSASRHMAAPAAGAARLPLDTLLARAVAALPADQAISSVTVKAEADAPVTFGLAARRYAYADPYTGALLPASQGLQTFYFEMERWHRAMAMGEGLRGRPGVTITGASNLAFLFLILSGLLLWIPRQATWRAVRAVLLFERGVRGRRRDWNWHHVLGIWSAPVLVLLVASGVFISYQWPQALLERATGGAPAATQGGGGGGRGGGRPAAAPATVVPVAGLDAMAARAAAAVPGWRTVQLRLPREPEAAVSATVSTTTAVRPDRRTALTFEGAEAAMTVEPGYATQPAARRIRAWVRGVHTGEAGGVAGQAVAGLVCLAAVVLVWTGVALAWRRFLRAVGPRRRAVVA